MKKNKNRVILLLIMFILLCAFPICFVYFYPNKFEEEISLGARIDPNCYIDHCTQIKVGCRCTKCQTNYVLRGNACSELLCSPGSYRSGGQCKSCPAGSECSGGKSQPIKCSENTYSTSGQRDCTQCRGITNSSRTKCYSSCSAIGYSDECRSAGCYWDYAGGGQCVSPAVNCPAGQYSKNGVCAQCPAGTYSTGGNVINCMDCKGITDVNRTSCNSCAKGYYAASPSDKARTEAGAKCEDDKCSCVKCSGLVVHQVASDYEKCYSFTIDFPPKISPSDSGSMSAALRITTNYPSSYTWVATNDGSYISGSFEPVSGTVITNVKGTIKPCSSVTVSVSVDGEVVATASASVSSNWSSKKVRQSFAADATIPPTRPKANDANSSYYNASDCYSNGPNSKSCLVYARSCGTGNGPQLYNYCCVNNGVLAASTDAIYKENESSKACPDTYTLLENVEQKDCVIKKEELGSCDTTTVSSPKKNLQASTCEDTVTMSVDEGKHCTNIVNNEKNSFYEITCAKTVKTSFDYGNDGNKNTSRTLYKGEGFAFGVNVDTTINCKYTFYDTIWKAAYNNVTNKIKAINSNLIQYVERNDKVGWENYINNNVLNKNGINNVSELYRLWNLVDQLRNVVKAYNEFKPSDEYKEQGRISVKTKENGKDVINKYELLQTVKSAGTTKLDNVKASSLNVPLVNNPKSYILTSSSPRKVVLIPKRTCINRSTGEVKTVEGNNTCPDNSIDGGNKIYISYNTDVTSDKKYTLSVEVDGLGTNNSEVKNDKCDLNVLETAYIYRPIDVGNPFINSSWEKGKNWVNETYDFTKAIHSSTWSENTYKKIVITAKDIEAIKKSNSDNRTSSPYLGLCDKQNVTVQDEITRKLCEIIKK